ncbi:type II secretion system major pseudopilin GspG [Maricaulis virginensis]|uniref:Type II secretion system core protein G n=1 Tax=Maricaulis virginensis TaxID=144022 RepID=A0A9W6MP15_9PROT|nr:type II secretion system major pseudopilin GspG [Maricaulis virginensis]GLK52678.1 type II secretion system protein GspG [Maricaulis virginensis]
MSRLKAVLKTVGERFSVARPGYSLMEILVAVAIIAVLATLVAPRLFGQLDRARVTSAETQIDMLETALDSMRLDIGRYPTNEEGLALLSTPNPSVSAMWQGPYLDEELPTDPWGNPYRYRAAEGQSDRGQVYSLGADNAEGGSGLDADIGI